MSRSAICPKRPGPCPTPDKCLGANECPAVTPSEARARHAALRDWMEDFGHENGSYECECCICEQTFYGHKRRVVCKICAAF